MSQESNVIPLSPPVRQEVTVEAHVAEGDSVMRALAAAENQAPLTVSRIAVPQNAVSTQSVPMAAPPTRIHAALPSAAGDEITASRPESPATMPTPQVILAPAKGPRFATGVLVGLLAGLVGGIGLAPLVAPSAPVAVVKGPITTYLDGAEQLAKEQRYDAALELLERVHGMQPPDPEVNVRLVTLTANTGLQGGVMRLRRMLALGNLPEAREELQKLTAFDPSPALLAQLRAEIEGKPAPAGEAAPSAIPLAPTAR